MKTESIKAALRNAQKGIGQYLELMDLFPRTNVARDKGFQRKFNSFYRVRQRPAAWYREYYLTLERAKTGRPTFEAVLAHLYSKLGRCEASFASKLVATIDPEQPVWDTFVLKYLSLKPPSYSSANRAEKVVRLYATIENWYKQYLKSDEARRAISIFNQEIPQHDRISDLKKIDFILWQTRS